MNTDLCFEDARLGGVREGNAGFNDGEEQDDEAYYVYPWFFLFFWGWGAQAGGRLGASHREEVRGFPEGKAGMAG